MFQYYCFVRCARRLRRMRFALVGSVGLQHGSVVSLAASSYYGHDQGLVATQQHGGHGQHGSGAGGGNGGSGNGSHSPGKYQENGHDTFSDFVTLVCQEAQNTQNAQVTKRTGERNQFVSNLLYRAITQWKFHRSTTDQKRQKKILNDCVMLRFKRDHRVVR